jgi:phenylalanyl-tRNA synthetase beta chain
MVLDLCGGEPSETIRTGDIPDSTTGHRFPLSEVKRLSGIDLSRC